MTEHHPVRIGVIGAGKIGGHHARIASRLPGVKFVGVCDTNFWRAQITTWRCGGAAFRNPSDLLKQVDAAIVAVPTEKHLEVGKAALEMGVHCLIEKPLAASVKEANELLDISEQKRAVLQVGHVERFNPAVLEAIRSLLRKRLVMIQERG